MNIFGAPLRFAAQVSSSPDYLSQWPGCFYCRTSFGEASFVGRNQTQTTKDTIDRTLSDTAAAKSTVNQSIAEREQLADMLKEGEFGWASKICGTEVPEIPRPASAEVGNSKICPPLPPSRLLRKRLGLSRSVSTARRRPCSKHSVKRPACSATLGLLINAVGAGIY